MASTSAKESSGVVQQPIELSTSGTMNENYGPNQCGSENIVSNTQDLERVPPQGLQSESGTPEPRSNWKVFATMLALSVCFLFTQ